ncbi:MAG: flavocytochrome c [Eubacteriaceae bacterium]
MKTRNNKIPRVVITMIFVVALILSGCNAQSTDITNTDVIVVGSGAAGLSAAISAAESGVQVTLLEKMPVVGGSSRLCDGVLFAAESHVQEEQGIEDSKEALYTYWMEIAEDNAEEDLVKMVADKSADAVQWLTDMGVVWGELDVKAVDQTLRGHNPEGKGAKVIEIMLAKAEELGVEVVCDTPATELIVDENGVVTGVEAENADGETIEYLGKAVILATGGFTQNEELIKEYAPMAIDSVSWTNIGNTGDGLIMARDAGAEIIAKDGVIGARAVASDILPMNNPIGITAFSPTLLVDPDGKRLANEVDYYATIFNKMVETGHKEFYLIFDNKNYTETLDDAVDQGYAVKADTLEELATIAKIEEEEFLKTVKNYNEMAVAGEDTQFNKPSQLMTSIEDATFYAMKLKLLTLGSFGGPKINLDAQVINGEGEVITGLFAAGEVANGQFYGTEYPGSGTAITYDIVMGRIAGEVAANAINE